MPDIKNEELKRVQVGMAAVLERIYRARDHVDLTLKFAEGRLIFYNESRKTIEKDLHIMFESVKKEIHHV